MIIEAGPQMDAKIARRLWRVVVFVDNDTGKSYLVQQGDYARIPLPAYSTDLDESYRVVGQMQSKGYMARFQHSPEENMYYGYFAKDSNGVYVWSAACTMPLVVCVAALAALDGVNKLKE